MKECRYGKKKFLMILLLPIMLKNVLKTFFFARGFFSFSTSTNLINSNVRLLRLSQVSCYCVFFGGFRDNFIYYGNLLNNPGYIFCKTKVKRNHYQGKELISDHSEVAPFVYRGHHAWMTESQFQWRLHHYFLL